MSHSCASVATERVSGDRATLGRSAETGGTRGIATTAATTMAPRRRSLHERRRAARASSQWPLPRQPALGYDRAYRTATSETRRPRPCCLDTTPETSPVLIPLSGQSAISFKTWRQYVGPGVVDHGHGVSLRPGFVGIQSITIKEALPAALHVVPPSRSTLMENLTKHSCSPSLAQEVSSCSASMRLAENSIL